MLRAIVSTSDGLAEVTLDRNASSLEKPENGLTVKPIASTIEPILPVREFHTLATDYLLGLDTTPNTPTSIGHPQAMRIAQVKIRRIEEVLQEHAGGEEVIAGGSARA